MPAQSLRARIANNLKCDQGNHPTADRFPFFAANQVKEKSPEKHFHFPTSYWMNTQKWRTYLLAMAGSNCCQIKSQPSQQTISRSHLSRSDELCWHERTFEFKVQPLNYMSAGEIVKKRKAINIEGIDSASGKNRMRAFEYRDFSGYSGRYLTTGTAISVGKRSA